MLLEREGVAAKKETGGQASGIQAPDRPRAGLQHASGITKHKTQSMGNLEGQKGGRAILEAVIKYVCGTAKGTINRGL
jgi:hypothetical protein